MTTNRQVALDLAYSGLSVFPASAENKKPAVPTGQNWQILSTIYPKQIDFWSWHYCMPAINLRKVALIVIDADRHGKADGVELFKKAYHTFGGLPANTPIVKTPNNGLHFYFNQPKGRAPLGCSRGNLPEAVDVKGYGGYVIAPNAILSDGRRYEPVKGTPDLLEAFTNAAIPEIPSWIVDLIEAPRRSYEARKAYAPPVAPRDEDVDARWATAALNAECLAVAHSSEGLRNETLFNAGLRIGELVAAGYLARQAVEASLLSAAKAAGVTPSEAARTLKSGIERGLTQPRRRPERARPARQVKRYHFRFPARASA
jgi:hypothetical protein